MHDSFNPGCRKGIKEAAWSENAFVHLVELDSCLADWLATKQKAIIGRCGAASPWPFLLPEKRAGRLVVHENESLLFQAALRESVYRYENSRNPLVYISNLAERTRRAAYLLKNDRPAFCGAIKRRITRARRSSV